MRYPDRVTMCISSQAGCGMNCPFCATGQGGLTRNLSTAEIVEQVVAGARMLRRGEVPGGDPEAERDRPLRVSNVVFMGMGEALANYTRAIGAIRRLTDPTPDGLGMSARGLTMSTVGLVPGIDRLAGEGIPVTLALSLHAPDDELRDELVPINTRWRGRRGAGRGIPLFRGDRTTGLDRIRPHPGRQRPVLARRPAGGEAHLAAAVAGCTSTRSRSTPRPAPAGPPRAPACSSSSSSGCGHTAYRRRSATPAAARSTAPAANSPRPPPELRATHRVEGRPGGWLAPLDSVCRPLTSAVGPRSGAGEPGPAPRHTGRTPTCAP
jgi:23S rRNA (adenine2503-C2)-methyltransferase